MDGKTLMHSSVNLARMAAPAIRVRGRNLIFSLKAETPTRELRINWGRPTRCAPYPYEGWGSKIGRFMKQKKKAQNQLCWLTTHESWEQQNKQSPRRKHDLSWTKPKNALRTQKQENIWHWAAQSPHTTLCFVARKKTVRSLAWGILAKATLDGLFSRITRKCKKLLIL